MQVFRFWVGFLIWVGVLILGWSFGFLGIDAVGSRLPGGYTVEWFWVIFYMWLLFDLVVLCVFC